MDGTVNPHQRTRDWLTVPEAAELAEVHENTLRAWARRFELGRRVGGRYRINRVALETFVTGVPGHGQRAA